MKPDRTDGGIVGGKRQSQETSFVCSNQISTQGRAGIEKRHALQCAIVDDSDLTTLANCEQSSIARHAVGREKIGVPVVPVGKVASVCNSAVTPVVIEVVCAVIAPNASSQAMQRAHKLQSRGSEA